jgi:predicted component of type VI protein secretion system
MSTLQKIAEARKLLEEVSTNCGNYRLYEAEEMLSKILSDLKLLQWMIVD